MSDDDTKEVKETCAKSGEKVKVSDDSGLFLHRVTVIHACNELVFELESESDHTVVN